MNNSNSGYKLTGWKFYTPEDGTTAEYATEIYSYNWQRLRNAEDYAELAVEQDYESERELNQIFNIVLVDPEGNETHWKAMHEATVVHHIERNRDE